MPHPAPVEAVALREVAAPGGTPGGVGAIEDMRLATGDAEGTLRVWAGSSGECLHTLPRQHAAAVRGLRWVGEAALFSGAADGTVAYADLLRGGARTGGAPEEQHAGAVCALALQQGGGAGGGGGGAGGEQVAATAGEDCQIKLWSLRADAAPACSRTLSGHAGTVRGVAMEGELLVSGSDDCSIRVWSLASGQCVENVTAKVTLTPNPALTLTPTPTPTPAPVPTPTPTPTLTRAAPCSPSRSRAICSPRPGGTASSQCGTCTPSRAAQW